MLPMTPGMEGTMSTRVARAHMVTVLGWVPAAIWLGMAIAYLAS